MNINRRELYRNLASGAAVIAASAVPAIANGVFLESQSSHALVMEDDMLTSITPVLKISLDVIKKHPELIEYFPDCELPDEYYLAAFDSWDFCTSKFFKTVPNPSEKLLLLMAKRINNLLDYVQNPSYAVQKAGVEHNPYAIRHIKNPSEELQLIAVNKLPSVIHTIKNPSVTVQMAAVTASPESIRLISNPAESVQLAAMNLNPEIFKEIPKPTDTVIALNKSYQEAKQKVWSELIGEASKTVQKNLTVAILEQTNDGTKIVYVEEAMKIFKDVGGFTSPHCEMLRKLICKRKDVSTWKEEFIKSAIFKECSRGKAEMIWMRTKDFLQGPDGNRSKIHDFFSTKHAFLEELNS